MNDISRFTCARFWRCALQVNPVGYNEAYRGGDHGFDEDGYNQALLRKCLEMDISVIGLADHGCVDSIDTLRNVLKPHGITVFPGFEIASNDKTHYVCLFAEDTTVQQLDRYLGNLKLHDPADGIRPSRLSSEELIDEVDRLGGFLYAAHCTQESGLLRNRLNHVWKHPKLRAAQIPGAIDDLTSIEGDFYRKVLLNKGHDKENPHCHLLISERVNDGISRAPGQWFKRAAKDPSKGGAKKTNELRPREWLLQCRELWAERANHALRLAGHEARIDHRTLEAQGIDRVPTTHLGPSVAAMERKGIRTMRGSRNRQRENEGLQPAPHVAPKPVSAPTPVPAPTLEECQAVLLALAKQEPGKIDSYYQEQIKPYMEYFDEAEDKAEAFAFCRERMEADMTTEAPCLKEMSRELSERLRRFGGTWAEQGALQKEAMNHIRLAPDREQAFASITGEMDRALERSRGLGR